MAHPLLCWDIVSEGLNRRLEFAKDMTNLQHIIKKNDWNLLSERSLDNSIVWENKAMLVTNLDLKIVLATKNIIEMGGYRPLELIGKSPRMFQGKATTEQSRNIIRQAVEKHIPFITDIVNYRKDGSIYNCHIEGYPIFNKKGHLVNFVALENVA